MARLYDVAICGNCLADHFIYLVDPSLLCGNCVWDVIIILIFNNRKK